MKTVTRLAAIAVACVVGGSVQAAEEMTLSALKAAGGKELTGEELKALLPGKTGRRSVDRYDLIWLHDADGKLRASSVERTGRMVTRSYPGTWRVSDNGQYCLHIEWYAGTEQWCRFVFKLGDDYLGFDSKADDAVAKRKFTLR